MGKYKHPFRPQWLTTSAADMSPDDIGTYIGWLKQNMPQMKWAEREKAKLIYSVLKAEREARRSRRREARDEERLEAEVRARYANDIK